MSSASNGCVPLAAISQSYTVYAQSVVPAAVWCVSPAVSWNYDQTSQSVHSLLF